MAEAVGKLKKPLMRGLLRQQIKRNLVGAFIVTASSVVAWKVFVANDNKKRYADYYTHYDIDKEFDNMRKKGVFDSCSPTDD